MATVKQHFKNSVLSFMLLGQEAVMYQVASTVQPSSFSIAMIQDEVHALVTTGAISRCQRLYALCQHFPLRDWLQIERILESHDYLMRDCVGDLISQECWSND